MSYESYNPNGPLIRKKNAAKRKKNLINLALEKRTKPITIQALKALQVEGHLSKEIFNENIGKIFPLVLLLVSQGRSILYIEAFLGMRPRSLSGFIDKHPRLKKACNEARKVKSDRSSLDAIELEYILS